MDEIYFPLYDWRNSVSCLEDLKREFPDVEYRGPGWYISPSHKGDDKRDYLLITEVQSSDTTYTYPIQLYCWNGYDPRPLMAKVMALPVHTGV